MSDTATPTPGAPPQPPDPPQQPGEGTPDQGTPDRAQEPAQDAPQDKPWDDRLSSALDEAAEESAGEETEQPEESETPETPAQAKEGEEKEGETEKTAQADDSETSETPDEEFTWDDEESEEKAAYPELRSLTTGDPEIDKNPKAADAIRRAFMQTEAGRRKLEHWHGLEELGKPEDEGGIGYIPEPSEIRQLHADAQVVKEMHDDLRAAAQGDTQAVSKFWEHFIEPEDENSDRLDPSGVAVVSGLPRVLAERYPGLHNQIGTNYVLGFAQQLLEQAAVGRDLHNRPADENTVNGYKSAAAWLKFALEGDQGQDPRATSGRADPEAERIRHENEELRNRLQNTEMTQREAYEHGLISTIDEQIRSDVERRFGSLKDALGDYAYDATVNTLVLDVKDAIEDHVIRQTAQAADEAWKAGGGINDIQPALERHRRAARSVIDRLWRERSATLPKTAKSVVADSENRHDQLRRAESNGDVSAGGKASPRVDTVARKEGESFEDAYNRAFTEATEATLNR